MSFLLHRSLFFLSLQQQRRRLGDRARSREDSAAQGRAAVAGHSSGGLGAARWCGGAEAQAWAHGGGEIEQQQLRLFVLLYLSFFSSPVSILSLPFFPVSSL
ncbi:hypothetical protein M0R45_006865 [Rubus argutus]|uniref:Uncharacterized protein n=1 Tax=Rubus argutus TaxID=59490 RepID=A0AAW1YRV1_RUBAR